MFGGIVDGCLRFVVFVLFVYVNWECEKRSKYFLMKEKKETSSFLHTKRMFYWNKYLLITYFITLYDHKMYICSYSTYYSIRSTLLKSIYLTFSIRYYIHMKYMFTLVQETKTTNVHCRQSTAFARTISHFLNNEITHFGNNFLLIFHVYRHPHACTDIFSNLLYIIWSSSSMYINVIGFSSVGIQHTLEAKSLLIAFTKLWTFAWFVELRWSFKIEWQLPEHWNASYPSGDSIQSFQPITSKSM